MLFDRLNKAIEKVNPSYEEDSFIDVCSDPSEYGLDGASEKVEENTCPVDIDPEDPSIYNSISNHNDEVLEKRWQDRHSKQDSEVIKIHCPLVKEEHVQEGDHVFTKQTYVGDTASLIDAKNPEGKSRLTLTEEGEARKWNCNSTKDSSFSEPTCTSNVSHFLETYVDSGDAVQVLRYDLMKLLADVQWLKESGNQNEQFALDWVDAINELSCSF